MRDKYKYDVFISYSHEDEDTVRLIRDRVRHFGFSVFWSPDLPRGKDFRSEIKKALEDSQHFVLFCTEPSSKSHEVKDEWQEFLGKYHLPDKDNRRMHVLLGEGCDAGFVPNELRDLNRPKSADDLVAALARSRGRDYERTVKQLGEAQQRTAKQLEEAQRYYRRNRFWGPIVENGHVHVFTCGRDVALESESSRGSGGRTNIDMWDYRAVLDIAHFFASNHPNTRITIEDPISKLPEATLESTGALSKEISNMRSTLEDKDCIIVGSPDVNDFAEIVLAEIHQMAPYTKEGPVKKKGFVILKDLKLPRSSCYRETRKGEQEGIAQILGTDTYHLFPHELEIKGDTVSGTMYGILIVANNPFRKPRESREPKEKRKIVILSGFSGVATNAIAKILTDEAHIAEFFKLDNAFTDINQNIEALVGVKYKSHKDFEIRDTREIDRITFEGLVEI